MQLAGPQVWGPPRDVDAAIAVLRQAVAAVRLVNKDGDVIWSTTQESQGGKFRRASTDVADRNPGGH